MGGVPAEVDAERQEQVKYWTAVGLPASVIAERLGVTIRTVVRYRKKTGCSRPRRPRMTADDIAAASRMLDDGCSYHEVGLTLGFAGPAIARHFPGRAWTRQQISEFGNLHRRLSASVVAR